MARASRVVPIAAGAAAAAAAGARVRTAKRKRAKDVRHAAEILGRNKLARRAHKLGDLLGDDHDLVMLLDVSRRLPAALSEQDRELFERLLERRRTELRSAALER